MKILFFGSSNFSLPSLKALLSLGHQIPCVITQPDRKKGRGLDFCVTPVKLIAQQAGLNIFQPEDINSSSSFDFLKKLECEIFVVIAYGQILSLRILELAEVMSLNAHASLLPKYRGASPINRAIINGDKTTGVTIIKMVPKMDAGPIILQEPIDIDQEDTAITLGARLSDLAAKLLADALESIEKANYKLTPQDKRKTTFAPRLKKEDGLIDWSSPASRIQNLIRGCIEWPGAFTFYKGTIFKIFKARAIKAQAQAMRYKPGEIIAAGKEGICVATGEGDLFIEELQVAGKRRMTAEEFLSGHKISRGEIFYKK